MKRILIVDDELSIRQVCESILREEGFETISIGTGKEALQLFQKEKFDLVLLDVWLPDRDGLEVLQGMILTDDAVPIIMISGHGTISTAVKALKMGAYDFLEKPLSYDLLLQTVREGLAKKPGEAKVYKGFPDELEDLPPFMGLKETGESQRTLKSSTVIYGLGLHSGQKTGMILQPLPPNKGIHFLVLPHGISIPARVPFIANTTYATTLSRNGTVVQTVEHLLSALHAYGIHNLLIKVHNEIPVVDGSALPFCQAIEEVGIEEQNHPARFLCPEKSITLTFTKKKIILTPAPALSIRYHLDYPPPIGKQTFHFTLTDKESFKKEIAPSRTFGFMKDLEMLKELGLGSGGRLDNCILVGDDRVINTPLRFPDEFVRHKILDILGDLYLLGCPLKASIEAYYTGHEANVALVKELWKRHLIQAEHNI